jgi:peptidoglycan/xylan/chitin deacetylase (PgdA/CDA1 family)
LKSLLYLAFFYGGIFHLVRAWRKLRSTNRACILLYHRVNDQSEDPLTTSIERFAEQMAMLERYYQVVSTPWIVEAAKTDRRLPDHSIAIHFDDCYRDVYTNASRILAQMDFPACCFISSGYVETNRIFPHDAEKCPFPMQNLTAEDLVGLTRRGFTVGAHTVTHADLGQCSDEQATYEVVQSKKDLEKCLHRPVTVFSYPYGEKKNIREEVVNLIRQSGYEALFSAYGGYFDSKSDLYDLPRWSVSSRFRPLDLLMEIEGLSISAFKRRWRAALSRRGKEEKLANRARRRGRHELTNNQRA